jgi:hypothetical protein
MTEILRAHRWGTNARMIAEAVAPLGYVEGDVFDATFGLAGGFWKDWRPSELITNDLNAPADFHEDFTEFSFDDKAACTVVYDPPYKLNGTPAMGDMDSRFGTGEGRLNREQKLAMIRDGALECYRITSRWLLVKVMDQVEGGQMRWQTVMVHNALAELGARLVDRFDFLTTPRPQPGDRRQLTARSNYSTLLVFSKGSTR